MGANCQVRLASRANNHKLRLKFFQRGESQSGASAETPQSEASPLLKILYGLTHPVQYQSPLIRHLAAGGVDIEVVSARGEEKYFDREFGCEIAWDLPLLEGYPSRVLPAAAPSLSAAELKDFYLEHLLQVFASKRPAAAWIHGWSHPFERAFWEAARRMGVPLMIRGDSTLAGVGGGLPRRLLHRLYHSWRFRQVSACLAVGSENERFYQAYGVSSRKIFRVPYAVNNAFFQSLANAALPRCEDLRRSLGFEPGLPVVLFCGKLITKKDAEVLIRAMSLLRGEIQAQLLVVGDGELRPSLEKLAAELLPGRAKFAGFKNQSELPEIYKMCDVFAIPSTYEPFGMVVNEVMNACKPVIASDRVGCWPDLVKPGGNGAIFPAGDVNALADVMRPFLLDAALCSRSGMASLEIINQWSFEEDLTGIRTALEFVGRA
jgi:glycosyltransferase involved in cell wall biosynthesis